LDKNDGAETIEAEPGDDGGVGAIADLVGFNIRLAYGAVYRHFMETFAHLELTQKQVSVMWLVSDHPGIGQSELARRLQMDRATVMAIVNRLQARGYLVREAHGCDARRRVLALAPAGSAALVEARAAIIDHERWLTSRFSKREVKQLMGLLARIHG
jgi:DNA-binding MarR family transcriptional regulator